MINARKLQYYTMAHRLQGYAEGLDEDRYEALADMLMKAAKMLEETWEEYHSTLPKENRLEKNT
jgi:sulfite reductase alpha subunit-like flavoprotein